MTNSVSKVHESIDQVQQSSKENEKERRRTQAAVGDGIQKGGEVIDTVGDSLVSAGGVGIIVKAVGQVVKGVGQVVETHAKTDNWGQAILAGVWEVADASDVTSGLLEQWKGARERQVIADEQKQEEVIDEMQGNGQDEETVENEAAESTDDAGGNIEQVEASADDQVSGDMGQTIEGEVSLEGSAEAVGIVEAGSQMSPVM